jgi:hypothetical protein
MKKHVMLSILAVTSTSMAYANANLTNQIKTDVKSWTDATTGISVNSGVYVSTGASIQQKLASQLLPGKYILTWSTGDNVKVSINGTEYTSGKEYTLASTSDFTIKAESKDGTSGFKIGGFKLEFVYDFKSIADQLTYNLSVVINKIDTTDTRSKNLSDRASEIAANIATVKDDDNATFNAYAVYQKFSLDKGVTGCTIATAINTLKTDVDALNKNIADAAANEAAYTKAVGASETQQKAFDSVNKIATNYALKKYSNDSTTIANDIADFNSKAKAAFSNGTAISIDSVSFTKTVSGLIATYKTNVTTANADDADYNIVADSISAAKSAYVEALKKLGVELAGNTYYNMLTAAQGELKAEMQAVTKAETDNGTADAHDNATESKTANLAAIATAKKNIAAIVDTYTKKATALKSAYANAQKAVKEVKANFDAVKTAIKVVIDKYAADTLAISNKISALNTKIESANAANTITDATYSADTATINKAISDLSTKAKPTVDNYNANQATLKTIANLQTKFDGYKKEVNAIVSTDKKYNANGKYAPTEKTLQATIDGYSTAAKKAYDAVKATSFTFASATTDKNIQAYRDSAFTALGAYNKAAAAITKYNKQLDTLKAVVTNTDVTLNGSTTTYGAEITRLGTAITAIQTNLNKAVALSDTAHYNALTKLDLNVSISTDITALKASYATDKTNYDKTVTTNAANKMLEQANARVSAMVVPSYTVAQLGNSYNLINNRIIAIQASLNAQKTIISNVNISSDAAAAIATLSKVNTALTSIQNSIDAVNADAVDIIAKVSANNEKYNKVATPAIQSLKDNLNGSSDGKIKGVEALNKDANFNDYFQKAVAIVNKSINTQENNVIGYFSAETLVAKWDSIKTNHIDTISAHITALRTEAQNATANLNAKDAQLKAYQAIGFKTKIDAAQKFVKALNDSVSQVYYNGIFDGYRADSVSILKDIDTYYKNKQSVAKASNITTRIKTLNDNIDAICTSAKANADAYVKEVQKGKDVQKAWDAVYYDLSTKDQSSALKVYLAQLAALQTRKDANDKAVTNNWNKGISAKNDDAVMGEYTSISDSIKSINDVQSKTYNAAIAADNLGRITLFRTNIKDTKDAYTAAINTINEFSDIKNAGYSAALNDIIDANKKIYNYSSLILALNDSAEAVYARTKSPELFDENSEYSKQALTYKNDINTILTTFTDAVNAKAIAYFVTPLQEANKKLTDAKAALSATVYDAAVSKDAFNDVATLIGNAAAAESKSDFALQLDGILTSFDGIDAMITSDNTAVAGSQWTKDKKTADDKISADEKTLNDTYKDAASLKSYQALVKSDYDPVVAAASKAVSDGNLFSNLATIKTTNLKAFQTKAADIMDAAKAAYVKQQQDDTSFATMNDSIARAQKSLDAASAYISKYYIASAKIAAWVNPIQSEINALQLIANTKADTQIKYVADSCANITKKVNNSLYTAANQGEFAELLGNGMGNLKREYNTASAALGISNSDIIKYSSVIESLSTALTGIEKDINTTAAAKQSGLQPEILKMEKSIALTRTEIANLYNAQLAANALKNLQSDLKKVQDGQKAELAVLDTCYFKAADIATYRKDLNAIKVGTDSIDKLISIYAGENTVLFYNDNVAALIKEASDKLAVVTKNIADAQAPYTANKVAYQRLTADVTAEKSKVASLTEVYNGYTKQDPTYADAIKALNNYITGDSTFVEDNNKTISLTKDSVLPNKSSFETALAEYGKQFANFDVAGRISVLAANNTAALAQINAAKYLVDKGTLTNTYSAIRTAITALSTYNYSSYNNGYVTADVDGKNYVDAKGNVVKTNVDYMTVALPAVNNKITEIGDNIKALLNSIKESTYLLGDVNGDKKVNVVDYSEIVNMSLEREEYTVGSAKYLAADVNEDKNEQINIGDITKVGTIIMNAEASGAKSSLRLLPPAPNDDALTLSASGEGKTQRITVSLNNSVAYVGGQMDITLPEGMTLLGESLSSRANGHELASNDLSNGSHRVIISNMENNEFNSGESALLYLDVDVSNYRGNGNIEISNVMFADASARIYTFANTTSSQATGINTVTNSTLGSKIYSIGGAIKNAVTKGVNIIRKSDGSTKKVLGK